MSPAACNVLEEIVRLVATRLIARNDLLRVSTEEELGGNVRVIMEGQHVDDHGQLVGIGGRTFKAMRDLVEHAAERMGGFAELVLRDPVRNGPHRVPVRGPLDAATIKQFLEDLQQLIDHVLGFDCEILLRDDGNGRAEIHVSMSEVSPKIATAMITLVKAIGKARWNKNLVLVLS